MLRRPLVALGLCCAALLIAIGIAVAHLSTSRSLEFVAEASSEVEGEGKGKMPPALARRLERLKSLPGAGGENTEGRSGAAADRFFALAYPGDDIPFESLQEARAASARLTAKGGPDGPPANGVPGAWASVGPSMALYPFTELRNSALYVPNKYVAGGRATAVAIDPNCQRLSCRIWVFAAGGGVWRAANAVRGLPIWEFISPNFGIQSGSSITLDPNDPTGNTLYVGTGEANASGDSAAGVGMYKSTDGGTTWTGPLGVSAFAGRAIGSIEVVRGDPQTIYAATTRGVLGVSSVSGGGVSLIPGAPAWGLYKSTDGGTTWTFLHNGATTAAACDTVAEATAVGSPCSIRGVRRVALDPGNPSIVYAGSYVRGVWRSPDGGVTWEQIKPSLATSATDTTMRPEIAVAALPDGKTRMYVHEGSAGSPTSRLFRSDDVATGAPAFVNLSSSNVADSGYATHNLCTGQCWYDSFVYTPPGYPDIVYVGGSYSYGERYSNKRGVVLSTDGGVTATDMTMDATDPVHPNGLHPDQHALVTHPTNPFQFFEVNDGGLMRSSGQFADVSHWCEARGLTNANQLARCRQLLSRVPTELVGLNKGMATLQFQSLSVSPFDPNLVQGGTQDNGTWQTPGNPLQWINTMIGDGGQSGFDIGNPSFRFHTFFDAQMDVNFSDGVMADWNWIGDLFFIAPGNSEPRAFYIPIITDPVVSRTMFTGLGHVWRTKTWGMGSMTLDYFREQCNEWTGVFTVICGDWEPLGGSTVNSRLTGTDYGADRTGGYVVAVERATGNTSTLWAATQVGRVFISRNADADPANAVAFTRLDSLAANDPNRFVSGIYIDPSNANRAWISYSGFNAATPTTPGHVFQVTYDPDAGTATWVDLSYDFGELPATDIVRDDARGDLYVSTDYGVFYLAAGSTGWVRAGTGLPNVEVAGLTIVPSARRIYAATHGLSAWMLGLP